MEVVRLYAKVEYFGLMFEDAELIDGVWHYETGGGNLVPFFSPTQIRVLDGPHTERRMTRLRKMQQA